MQHVRGCGSRNHLKQQFAKSTSWETKGTKTSTIYTSSNQVSTSSGEVLKLKHSKIKSFYSVMSLSIKRCMDAPGTAMFCTLSCSCNHKTAEFCIGRLGRSAAKIASEPEKRRGAPLGWVSARCSYPWHQSGCRLMRATVCVSTPWPCQHQS